MGFIEEYQLRPVCKSVFEEYYQSELKLHNRNNYLANILTKGKFSETKLKEGLLCYHLSLKKISDCHIIAAQTIGLALTGVSAQSDPRILR